jgi:hypothetical protein
VADAEWLWGVPNADPGTHDFGPALGEAEIAEWERRNGVLLPADIRTAYSQQNGGMIRSQRCFFYRLEEVESAGEEYFAELGAEPPQGVPADLVFILGYDDYVGATLFLGYRTREDSEPQLYGYHTDGGSVAYTASPAEIMHQANVWS